MSFPSFPYQVSVSAGHFFDVPRLRLRRALMACRKTVASAALANAKFQGGQRAHEALLPVGKYSSVSDSVESPAVSTKPSTDSRCRLISCAFAKRAAAASGLSASASRAKNTSLRLPRPGVNAARGGTHSQRPSQVCAARARRQRRAPDGGSACDSHAAIAGTRKDARVILAPAPRPSQSARHPTRLAVLGAAAELTWS